jgi:integral membrane sensor domain MASE1
MKSQSPLFFARMAILAVVYFGVAKLGLLLSLVLGNNTLVWPPTGIALAALLLLGPHLWPGVALGSFLAVASSGVPLTVAGGISVGNTLEALFAVFLLRRVVGFQNALERLQDVLGLAGLAAGLSTMVSATIDVTALCLGGVAPWDAYGLLWRVWWLGGAMSNLVVAPLILTWGSRPAVSRNPWRIAEAGALLASLTLVCLLVFGGWSRAALVHYSLDYVVDLGGAAVSSARGNNGNLRTLVHGALGDGTRFWSLRAGDSL